MKLLTIVAGGSLKLSQNQWRSARLILLIWLVTSALLMCSYLALSRKHASLITRSISFVGESGPLYIFSKDKCVGVIETSFKQESTIDFAGTGHFFLQSESIKQRVDVAYEINFNLLNQLVSGIVNVKSTLGEFRMSMLKVNPILVSVQLSRGEESFHLNQQVPGPLLLVGDPKGYSFRYEGSWKLADINLLEQPLVESLELEVQKGEPDTDKCSRDMEALDVSKITTLLSRLTDRVDEFLKL